MDPLHRIDPSFLSSPMLYGSAGEPSLSYLPSSPNISGNFDPRVSFNPGSLSPMFLGPLAAILMSPGQAGDVPPAVQNVREVQGIVRRPLNFDNLAFGKAFALARSLGLDQFNWRSNPYTTKLR